jgi:hypothetical protein
MDFVLTLCDTLDGQICPGFGNQAVTRDTAGEQVGRRGQPDRAGANDHDR